MINSKHKNWILAMVVAFILLIIPLVFGIVYINVFVAFTINAMYAISLNLLLGYTGLLSFGHALFFGSGAYAAALALTHIPGFPLLGAVLIGGFTAALVALIVSPLLVRVSGTAFAMLTLAFGQLMYVFCLKFREVTRGEDGIGGFPIPSLNIPGIVSIDMVDPRNFYYFAIAVLILCMWMMWFVTKTPFGSVVVGIRDNDKRIDYLGFKVPQTKAGILIISAGFAGVAGSIYALFQNLVSTDGVLSIFISFNPIMMAYIGGIGSFFGPILGSGVLHLLEELTSRYIEQVELLTGAVFIFVVLFAPMGFIGLWRTTRARWLAKENSV